MSVRSWLAAGPFRLAKDLVKKSIGLFPPPAGRLTGPLAKDGGKPVRDLRFRPLRWYPEPTAGRWANDVGPAMRRIFMSGAEGLPQRLSEDFAEKWAAYSGAKFGLLLPHGTDALRLALAAALDHDGLDYGGEVIVPNLTFIASASAALDRRFGVALVDVEPGTLNLDPLRVEEAIVPGRTRAIMAVHLFGQPADMTRLREVAERHSLVLIEDAAQAHGAAHELGRVGSIGAAAGFSFQSSKNLSSGEGGALTTNDPGIFERAYGLYNVGRSRIGGQRWGHNTLGFNVRPSEYVAAVLLHRMRTIEEEQALRFRNFLFLHNEIRKVTCVEPIGIGPGVVRHGAYMFAMRYRAEECSGLSIEDFLSAMLREGIMVLRGQEATLAQQPAMRLLASKRPEYVRIRPTPVADAAVEQLVYIPHPLLLGGEGDMKEIVLAFQKVQDHYTRGRTVGGAAHETQVAPVPTARPTILAKVQAPARAVRFGLVGTGAMGEEHATAIRAGEGRQVVGVVDAMPDRARQAARRLGCRVFGSQDELISSGEADVIVIAAPHPEHAALAAAALRAGLHVVCEKPMTVTVAEADELLRIAGDSKGKLIVVYQTRFDPIHRYVKGLLSSGELGPIFRCEMVESAWRSQAYYGDNPWRASWSGAAGGVLLNQAPHLLDRYAWLCGMPDSVQGLCGTAMHEIEVEDTASAILHHSNGAHGYVHVDTIESPGVLRTMITCDRGRVSVENGRVRVFRSQESLREKSLSDSRHMGDVTGETMEAPVSHISFRELLKMFYDELEAGLSRNGALPSQGIEGRNAVELANAIVLSSALGRRVELPLDRPAYDELLGRLRRGGGGASQRSGVPTPGVL